MQLLELIEKTVTGLGYELVDFETSPRARVLRVFIDRLPGNEAMAGGESQLEPEMAADAISQGGVTVDDCARVSNHLSRVLAVENIDYDRLEVSSPGLDRVLRKLSDFARFSGYEAAVKLRLPLGNQRNFTGVLCGVCEERVLLLVDGVEYAFAIGDIDRARLVPKF